MKIKSVEFRNFRMLKEQKVEFSVDHKLPLTVIRAANESGKTTLLTALQWALFGDISLPGRTNFRLSPLDSEEGSTIEIKSDLAFQIENQNGRIAEFSIVRSRKEKVAKDSFSLISSNISLLQVTDVGVHPIEHAQAWLKPHLPEELREVFFTDGDRALSFIEGRDTAQSKKVEGAIRSLLGLELLENVKNHVSEVAKIISKNLKSETAGQSELDRINQEVVDLEEEIPTTEENLKIVQENANNAREEAKIADGNLRNALKQGDKSKLVSQIDKITKARKRTEEEYKKKTLEQSALFKSIELSKELMNEPLNAAYNILQGLYDDGVIPNASIPLIKNRLNNDSCFCGSNLDETGPDGKTKRKVLEELIEKSEREEEQVKKASDLYYRSTSLVDLNKNNTFSELFNSLYQEKTSISDDEKDLGSQQAEIEAEISRIPDLDIQSLQTIRDDFNTQIASWSKEEGILAQKLSTLTKTLSEQVRQRDALLQKNDKGQRILANFNIANDLNSIFEKSLEEMKEVELQKVSDLMDKIFREMIGAAEEGENQSSIIQKAEITKDYIIKVHGSGGNTLNPSQDLNGASRRALTMAFILALTEISGVTAPNVIDTPLGMTSGYVKNSIMKNACKYSSQLIMLLTHDEIAGCEDIIEQYAGKSCTFTNPAHYPAILLNDPGINDIRVIQCNCDYNSECDICARRVNQG